MSFEANGLDEYQALATEADDAAFRVMEEWLRLENENTDPGFLLPGRASVVEFCETHATAIVFSANLLLWSPLIWVLCRG